MAPRRPAPKRTERRPGRLLVAAAVGLLALLAFTAEERTFGLVTDETQVLNTAVAMAELGEIGIARGQFFAIHRAAGDAVSPYGVGLSLLQVPVCLVAERWERAYGVGSSQTLFVLLQILFVFGAGLGAAVLVRALGGSEGAQAAALFAATVAQPLWAYTASGFSEPLQAACLVGALAAAAASARAEAPRRRLGMAALAGFLSAYAVLAKGVNVALFPLSLLPLAFDVPERRPLRARLLQGLAWFAGAAAPLALWLTFEIVRFGRPLSSYGGQKFTNPPLDGLWRLLVGLNKGLVVYFPLLVLALVGLAIHLKGREARGTALAAAGALGIVLAISSAWFAWDGTGGWGPRFLLPAVPGLAAFAVLAAAGSPARTRAAWALGVAGVLVNSLAIFQTEAATSAYVASTGTVPVDAKEAERFPDYYQVTLPGGGRAVSRSFYVGKDRAYAPLRVAAFLLSARLSSDDRDEIRRRLATPPWAARHPDAKPVVLPLTRTITTQSIWSNYMTAPFSWPRLFALRRFASDERALYVSAAWKNGLADQVLRNLAIGRPDRAIRLSRTLWELQPSGYHAALAAEALRGSGQGAEAASFLAGLDARYRSIPIVAAEWALLARDQGDEARARALLEAARRGLPFEAIDRALAGPVSSWPAGLHGLIAENLERGDSGR